MVTLDGALALKKYAERLAANASKTKIDNGSLPAGSPMHYYCRFCGEPTETLPEGHLGRPRTACEPCQVLRDHGLIDALGNVME